MIAEFTLRRATAEDAEALARGADEGVRGYGDFAPGWSGPGYEQELAHAREALEDPEYHAFVAEAGGAIAGQVAVLAADATALPAGDPTLGHVRNLFVAEGQARARRFYEREGWEAVTEPYFDPIPRLSMVEYRRPIG